MIQAGDNDEVSATVRPITESLPNIAGDDTTASSFRVRLLRSAICKIVVTNWAWAESVTLDDWGMMYVSGNAMSLRLRTALTVLAACAVAVVVLFFALQGILTAHSATLEKQKANEDLERASNALSQDVASLETLARDWALQNDMYQFVQGDNEELAADNLGVPALVDLGINFAVLIDSLGQTTYSKAVDLSAEAETPVPSGLEQYTSGEGLLSGQGSEPGGVAGILFLRDYLALVSSQPILSEVDGSPAAGSLIMGRYLDPEEVDKLSEMAGVPILLYRVDEATISADFEAARSALSEEQTSVVQVMDDGRVGAYMLVSEIQGSPAFVLRVDAPRDIYAQGQRTARHVLYLILGLGTLFGVLLILGLDTVVLSRLRRFTAGVERVRQSRNLSERVLVEGEDELRAVAETINGTLTSLEQSYVHLAESNARNQHLVDAMPDLVFRTNREGRIIEIKRPRQIASANDGGILHSQLLSEEQISLLSAQIRQTAVPHVTETLQSKQMGVFQFQLSSNSHLTQYEARVVPNGSDEALIIVRDVTRQKADEEALQNSVLLEQIHSRIGDLRQYLKQGLQRPTLASMPPNASSDSALRQEERLGEIEANVGMADAALSASEQRVESDPAPD